MRSRIIITLVVAIAVAFGGTLVSDSTSVVASGDHHHADPKPKKKKTRKNRAANPAPASELTGAVLVLGTQEAPRDVAVTMTDDLRFDPGTIVVTAGETIRFLLDNPTAAPHDFTLGDLAAQDDHHDQMAAGGGHEHEAGAAHDAAGGGHEHEAGAAHDAEADTDAHDSGEHALPGPVTLEPGESAEVIATFSDASELLIGCHVPGHWEAGMRGNVLVVPGTAALA